MKRIAFLTDIHGNLPAFKKALKKIETLGCDHIFLGGDVIGIGPYPAECMDLVLNHPKIQMVNGNHELVAICDESKVSVMCGSSGEIQHTLWYRKQLTEKHLARIRKNQLSLNVSLGGVNILFHHYFITNATALFPFSKVEQTETLWKTYSYYTADLICFGHDHRPSHHKGKTTLYNPGSLGCCREAIARFAIIDFDNSSYQILPQQRLFSCLIVPFLERIYNQML